MLDVDGPAEGVLGVHVGEEVQTLQCGLLAVRARGQQQAGLEAVQLVLAVEVLGEGRVRPQQEAEHEVEPHTAGEDLQAQPVLGGWLEGQVLPDGPQPVEEEVVEVLEAAGVQARPQDGGQQVPADVTHIRHTRTLRGGSNIKATNKSFRIRE